VKTSAIFLWLVMYPACGDAIYDLIQGPFSSVAACEIQQELVVAVKGPPAPGSIYKCGPRP